MLFIDKHHNEELVTVDIRKNKLSIQVERKTVSITSMYGTGVV